MREVNFCNSWDINERYSNVVCYDVIIYSD